MAHGRYTIVGKLADGGMAEIFLAVQKGAEGFEKPVVVKRVLSAFSADTQFRNMFIDEAHISMSLAHGNIVQVLDVGVSGGRMFLVLELVDGWDLEQVLQRAQATGPDHPWPPSLSLYVTAQICRALAYAHSKRSADGRPLGIVHRDVSPTNVLISEQGEVKLADFGIAKAERKREQTAAGVIKGKIGFMSPEQAQGRPLDARADLFSVGTLLYLMLTGRKPFEAPSDLESLMKAQKAEYRRPEELNPHLSPETTTIVNKAMRREPMARYQTADEMLVDVERVLRAQYRSAGQTELKTWLGELARRDGMPPQGRVLAPTGDQARPVFVDVGGDLSAGVSLELADADESVAPATEVSIPMLPPGAFPTGAHVPALQGDGGGGGARPVPPTVVDLVATAAAAAASARATAPAGLPRGAPAGAIPPATVVDALAPSGPVPAPAFSASASSGARASAGGAAAPPSAGVNTPSGTPAVITTAAQAIGRLPRRSRIGLGFSLGALCMLGAVFGIKWLAQWAGRDRLGSSRWYQVPPDSSSPSSKDPAGGPPPVAARAADDKAEAPAAGPAPAATARAPNRSITGPAQGAASTATPVSEPTTSPAAPRLKPRPSWR